MKQSNKILLENNLKEWLKSKSISSNLEEYKFEIKLDLSDTSQLSSNFFEEIMNLWILPKKVNKNLNKREVIDLLVTGGNQIPLWIGVKVFEKKLELVISKRFKKLKVVNDWHVENKTMPFIGVDELKTIPNFYKEFSFLYPAGMYDTPALECEEFEEICNVMALEKIDYKQLRKRIWENVENKNAEVLKINSTEYSDQYVLIDLWNHDQINVMNICCRTNGAINDFVYRSLHRWNKRLWNDLGPKIRELEVGQIKRLQAEGRVIEDYKNENAV